MCSARAQDVVLKMSYEAHVAGATVRKIESHGPESGPEMRPLYDTNICEGMPLLRCCLCALQA